METVSDVLRSVASGEGGPAAIELLRDLTPGQAASAIATLSNLIRADPGLCTRHRVSPRAEAIALHAAGTLEYVADETADDSGPADPAIRLPDFAPEAEGLASDAEAGESAWREAPGLSSAELLRDAACNLQSLALRMRAVAPDGPTADDLRRAAAETGESLAYSALTGNADEVTTEEVLSVLRDGVKTTLRAAGAHTPPGCVPGAVPAPSRSRTSSLLRSGIGVRARQWLGRRPSSGRRPRR